MREVLRSRSARRAGPKGPRSPGGTQRAGRGAVAAASCAGLVGALAGALLSCAALTAMASPSGTSLVVHAPRIPVNGSGLRNTWSSNNWSGYAETGSFSGVTAAWSVPAVAATASPTFSSAWVGVDGFGNSSLIQTGTEEDYYNGAAHYGAWWEILPAAETPLPPSYAVAAGDRMKAAIYETTSTGGQPGKGMGRAHTWVISLSDTSRRWSYTTTQSYNGPGASADWVVEAPTVNGKISTLAHYTITPPAGSGDFDNAGFLTSPVSAGSPVYVNAGLNRLKNAGVMIQNNVQVSTPGNPDSALTAFNDAYGSAVPATPTG